MNQFVVNPPESWRIESLDRPVDHVPRAADAAVTGMIRQPNIDSAAQS
jgi:hypothetical protein